MTIGTRKFPIQIVAQYTQAQAHAVRMAAVVRRVSVAELLREIVDTWAARRVKPAPPAEDMRGVGRGQHPEQMIAMVSDQTGTAISTYLLQHDIRRSVLMRRLVEDWRTREARAQQARLAADAPVVDQGAE